MTRKCFVTWALAGAMLVQAGFAAAQSNAPADFPNRPIRLIVPFAAGGGVDLMARIAAKALGNELKQTVIVENKPGASGTVAALAVSHAEPDGYTLIFHTTSSSTINAVTFTNLPYNPLKALVPVSLAIQFPLVVLTNPKIPAKNMREFVALLKANPGKYNYGSSGYGSIVHLGGEMFKSLAKVDIVHVPYKGNAPALTDLFAGRIAMMIDGVPPELGNIKAGKVRALAVTTAKRSPALPDVPTMIESGIPGYELSFWTAIFAPASTPKPILDLIAKKLHDGLQKPDVVARLNTLGAEGVGSTPEQLDAFWHTELARYKKVADEFNIHVKAK